MLFRSKDEAPVPPLATGKTPVTPEVSGNPVAFVNVAVIFPALKSPLASLNTIVETVFALVAVVAELLTLPVVEMVASFESAMAADVEISALTISPSFIFPDVIALADISGLAAVELVPARSPPN